jgi:calpain-15
LTAATALAEYPSRVKKIFKYNYYPKEGIFAIQFYYLGQPIVITIDDRLPLLENGTPVNARPSSQGAWWLVILEKAYAKMNLNYANLDGGMQYEAMRALTGQPIVIY